jgi:hypothetical protein
MRQDAWADHFSSRFHPTIYPVVRASASERRLSWKVIHDVAREIAILAAIMFIIYIYGMVENQSRAYCEMFCEMQVSLEMANQTWTCVDAVGRCSRDKNNCRALEGRICTTAVPPTIESQISAVEMRVKYGKGTAVLLSNPVDLT